VEARQLAVKAQWRHGCSVACGNHMEVRKPYGGEIRLRMDGTDKHLNLFWENVTTKSRWLSWSKVAV